jgi:hypothetical protein
MEPPCEKPPWHVRRAVEIGAHPLTENNPRGRDPAVLFRFDQRVEVVSGPEDADFVVDYLEIGKGCL